MYLLILFLICKATADYSKCGENTDDFTVCKASERLFAARDAEYSVLADINYFCIRNVNLTFFKTIDHFPEINIDSSCFSIVHTNQYFPSGCALSHRCGNIFRKTVTAGGWFWKLQSEIDLCYGQKPYSYDFYSLQLYQFSFPYFPLSFDRRNLSDGLHCDILMMEDDFYIAKLRDRYALFSRFCYDHFNRVSPYVKLTAFFDADPTSQFLVIHFDHPVNHPNTCTKLKFYTSLEELFFHSPLLHITANYRPVQKYSSNYDLPTSSGFYDNCPRPDKFNYTVQILRNNTPFPVSPVFDEHIPNYHATRSYYQPMYLYLTESNQMFACITHFVDLPLTPEKFPNYFLPIYRGTSLVLTYDVKNTYDSFMQLLYNLLDTFAMNLVNLFDEVFSSYLDKFSQIFYSLFDILLDHIFKILVKFDLVEVAFFAPFLYLHLRDYTATLLYLIFIKLFVYIFHTLFRNNFET